jgi:hypothetical protein
MTSCTLDEDCCHLWTVRTRDRQDQGQIGGLNVGEPGEELRSAIDLSGTATVLFPAAVNIACGHVVSRPLIVSDQGSDGR